MILNVALTSYLVETISYDITLFLRRLPYKRYHTLHMQYDNGISDPTAKDSTAELYLPTTLNCIRRSFFQNADSTADVYLERFFWPVVCNFHKHYAIINFKTPGIVNFGSNF